MEHLSLTRRIRSRALDSVGAHPWNAGGERRCRHQLEMLPVSGPGASEHSPFPVSTVWLLSRDAALCCSGSHYSQRSRPNTQSPRDAEHMAWLKKCSPAQRNRKCHRDKNTWLEAGCSVELSLPLKHVSTATVKPSAKHENGRRLDHIPLNGVPSPDVPHAHVKYQSACSSY